MQLYLYILTHDTGFAPNPFWGICTLACCMPVTRRVAKECDWIVGLRGATLYRRTFGTREQVPAEEMYRIIYAMQIRRKLTFAEYWDGPDFAVKRPD